jgi:hypothetical protein
MMGSRLLAGGITPLFEDFERGLSRCRNPHVFQIIFAVGGQMPQ